MAINKVDYFGTTLIDITDTTATPETVLQGYDFYDASGQKQTGTAETGTVLISDTEDEHGGTIRTITIVDYIYDGDNLPYGGQYSSIVGIAYTGQSYTASDIAIAGISKAEMAIVDGDVAIVGTALVDGMVAG